MNTRKELAFLNGNKNIIGKIIEKYREENNISRQELSNLLMLKGVDISSQSIFDIEKGERTVVDYELCAIAFVLKKSADDLMKDFYEYLKNT